MYREVLTFVDWFMATSALPAEAQMDFANESISLLADNI
jgi:hypothetical protein